MRDPTREEMQEFLNSHLCSGAEYDGIEIAIFWFAMYWHGGQGSNLYSVLSTSPYAPGPCGRLEDESDTVQRMYDALETEYKRATDQVRRGPTDETYYTAEEHEVLDMDPIRGGELT
jgi:hypothetical protein